MQIKEAIEKQTIHIWKGQEGTLCGLRHYPQGDGFVWLSKMGTAAAIQVNCKKCVDNYTKKTEQPPASEQERWDIETIGQLDKENKQLQARLDASEASRKDLVDACQLGLKSMRGLLEIGVELGASNKNKRKLAEDIRQVEAIIEKG